MYEGQTPILTRKLFSCCLPSPSARLTFAYGTATLYDGGLLQFESSPIVTTETLRLRLGGGMVSWMVFRCKTA